MERMGPGKSVHYKEVFTNQGCSLIRGVHYEKFHSTYINKHDHV